MESPFLNIFSKHSDTFSKQEADNLANIPPVNRMDDLSQSLQEHHKIEDEYNIDHLDEGYDIYALFCFEDVPLEMIEDVLEGSARAMSDVYHYWLADDYSTLPQEQEDKEIEGTVPPLSRTCRSRFLGQPSRRHSNMLRVPRASS
jgi:hypothetical protein